MPTSTFEQFQTHLKEFKNQLSRVFIVEGRKRKLPSSVRKIYICGMGGSGIVGDILSSILTKQTPEILTWKNYGIPHKEDVGFIFVSFSGDTKETISGLRTAIKECPSRIIGVVTSGGKLAEIAKKAKLPRIIIPKENLTPREALGYNTNASLTLLRSAFPSFRADSVSTLSPSILENESRKLAEMIKETIPLIYTEEKNRVIGHSWKMHLNETGKNPCFNNVLPEMGHNEIQSFENKKFPFTVLFLVENKSAPQIMNRVRASREILKKRNIKSAIITLHGKNSTERLWNGILLGAWTGLYLAKIGKKDPKETSAITELKKLIK